MTDVKQQFEQYLVQTKKVSSNTLSSYLRDIDRYFAYLRSRRLDPLEASSEQIQKFAQYSQNTGLSASSVTRMMATVRCFYRFAVQQGIMTNSPAQSVHMTKVEKQTPAILTPKEIERFLAQPDISEPKGCRDKAMLELLYATGIRVSELIDLNVEDVNLQLGVVYCRSGKTERMIPIYDEAREAVADYLKRVRGAVILDYREPALFTNMNGSRMTRQGFWKIVKTYTASARINKDVTPHTLRHSFAAHLLENGAQLKDLQEMLGHSDISSTQVYARMMKEHYQSVYSHCHPKARRRA